MYVCNRMYVCHSMHVNCVFFQKGTKMDIRMLNNKLQGNFVRPFRKTTGPDFIAILYLSGLLCPGHSELPIEWLIEKGFVTFIQAIRLFHHS